MRGFGLLVAAALVAAPLAAQCPNGAPPPCLATVGPRRAPPSADVRARRFLLLPFRNVSRAPAQDWLTTGAPLMLAELLGQYRDLTVVPEERLIAARRRLGLTSEAALDERQLRQLAEETDGWTAVSGNVIAAGPRLRISAQAMDIPTARVLVRAETTAPVDADIRPAFDTLRVRLLEAVGIRGPSSDIAAMSTQSVDAYRAYVNGIQLMQRSAFREARSSFAEAVRLDSTFALAWAKLAVVSVSANVMDLIDPTNPLARVINRAADNAGRLPPRQALLIRSLQAFFLGRPGRARAIVDSLVATDPDDLDAREWAASVGTMLPAADTTVRPARLVTSLNRTVALAREIIERDPGRRYVYSVPAYVYGMGAGLWGVAIIGVAGETGSVFASIMRAFQTRDFFVPVIRDTIVAVPMAEFLRLPVVEQMELRRRSADAGMQWVERWLSAGPGDGDAHIWASRMADLQGDYVRALREAEVADSLGVQSGFENVRGRRLRLLTILGRYDAANALADSLAAHGEMLTPGARTFDGGLGYSYLAAVAGKRWQRLAEAADKAPPSPTSQSRCIAIFDEFGQMQVNDRGVFVAAMDTATKYYGRIVATPALAGCAGNFISLYTDSTTSQRPAAAATLLTVGDSLVRAGQVGFGYRAMRVAWNADTSAAAHTRLLSNDSFTARSRTMALGRNFVPEGADVWADSAVFTLRATSTGPFELSYPNLPSRWSFTVSLRTDSGVVTLFVRHDYRAGDTLVAGGLPQLAAALGTRQMSASARPGAATMSALNVAATSQGLRLVVRGPLVTELRRLAPTTAEFVADPCVAVSEGLCSTPRIAVSYR